MPRAARVSHWAYSLSLRCPILPSAVVLQQQLHFVASATQSCEVHSELQARWHFASFGMQSTNFVRARVVVCGGLSHSNWRWRPLQWLRIDNSKSSSCCSKRCQLGTFGGWVAKQAILPAAPAPPKTLKHSPLGAPALDKSNPCVGNLQQYLWLKANVWLNSKD